MKKISIYILLMFASFSVMADTISIPLGGNAWAHGGNAQITNNGLVNWTDAKSVTDIYFNTTTPINIQAALKLRVPNGSCTITLKIEGQSSTQTITGADFHTVDFGKFNIKSTGYIKVQITGSNPTGKTFADISDLIISGINAANIHYVPNNEGDFFHWGRRGPSVHLRYALPEAVSHHIAWFYNEVTVPTGMDKIGSYFMADGFSVGYFGMQVNSATERRVLFSVWSPETTDDPNKIPEEKKIKLLKKGTNVHAGEFGNEGSGGQSYLVHPWKAGKTYCFLLHAEPDSAANTTVFTAYFKEKGTKQWQLIASFKRPQTFTYLTDPYSFLENFEPDHGDETRVGHYGNQWVADRNGAWFNLNKVIFTADNTARKGYRLDYSGGVSGNIFYLRNGGFFNDATPMNQHFERPADNQRPAIDPGRLP